jgi:hypothetical protein
MRAFDKDVGLSAAPVWVSGRSELLRELIGSTPPPARDNLWKVRVMEVVLGVWRSSSVAKKVQAMMKYLKVATTRTEQAHVGAGLKSSSQGQASLR